MDVVRQRLGAGGVDGVQAIGEHGAQDVDHLSVAAGLALQLALHPADRNRQVPRLERSSVAQGTGFAGQDGDVVQGVIDGFAAPEGTRVAADDSAVLPAFEPIGIGLDLDRTPHGAGIDGVSVVVEPHEAGLGDGSRNRVESIERANVGHQARSLFFEYLPDRLLPHLGVFVCSRIRPAPVFG